MVMINHEFEDSGTYTYRVSPDVGSWREVAEDRDSDTSLSVSTIVPKLNADLEPSVNLEGEPVMEDLYSFLLGLYKVHFTIPRVLSTGSNG
ncbi:hypothetical protein AYI68_g6958 [Smittium mucronatum]|uniref:Uncharacterized protein n=1 Tax=Smittium mucronatum TaxID=133383 RepID=A0A1R0GQ05_9FUNG|nr:hypothetical protein AYI68_g6958 [Smittium mucronatum]